MPAETGISQLHHPLKHFLRSAVFLMSAVRTHIEDLARITLMDLRWSHRSTIWTTMLDYFHLATLANPVLDLGVHFAADDALIRSHF
jgi:hypothetical protein